MDQQHNTDDPPVVWPLLERRRQGEQCDLMHRRMMAVEERTAKLERIAELHNTAFVKNDLGQPDFDGHRKAHLLLLKAAETMDDFKAEGAKNIVKMVLTFAAGVFSLGVLEWLKNLR